jgi:hypothetical protein
VQQTILKNGGWLPGILNIDEKDLAREALFTASTHKIGGEPSQVANGVSRRLNDCWNGWVSDGIREEGETLTMQLVSPAKLREVRLVFHSDFSYPIRVTMAPNRQKQQRPGVPAELIRDYDLVLIRDDKEVRRILVRDNHQRLNILTFDTTDCDRAEIQVYATNGAPDAVIFEVRAYAE